MKIRTMNELPCTIKKNTNDYNANVCIISVPRRLLKHTSFNIVAKCPQRNGPVASTDWPSGHYRMSQWPLQTGPVASTDWPSGQYRLAHDSFQWPLQNVPVAITDWPSGQYRLAQWPVQTGPVAITDWPSGHYRMSQWPLQNGPVAIMYRSIPYIPIS